MQIYVYEPREDSQFLANVAKSIARPWMKVLDVGTGTGFIAFEIAKLVKEIDAVDVNPYAIKIVKAKAKKEKIKEKIKLNVFYSNLFSHVNQKYDLIIFNPPYLPKEKFIKNKWIEKAIIGGKRGNELLIKFLEKAKDFLKPNGQILFCFSSFSSPKEILKVLDKYYEFKLQSYPLFFEKLWICLASKKLKND